MKVSELTEFLSKCPVEAVVMVSEEFNEYGNRKEDKWKELVMGSVKVDCRAIDFVSIL